MAAAGPQGTNGSERPFRFLDLPAELRIQIYSYLVPRDLGLWQLEDVDDDDIPFWTVAVQEKGKEWPSYELGGPQFYRGSLESSPIDGDIVELPDGTDAWSNDKYPDFQPQLFLVSKQFLSEARGEFGLCYLFVTTDILAILYGTNTFGFDIDGKAHNPVSLQSPRIFGVLGFGDRLHLLRELRTIIITIYVPGRTHHWTVKRLRARLQYFVTTLKEPSDDAKKHSLLETLRVELMPVPNINEDGSITEPNNAATVMLSLESLASLRGIKNVTISGDVPKWFSKCLELCIQGKGGEVKEIKYPLVEAIRRDKKNKNKPESTWTTTRKWYHPTLDWKDFAKRNDIALPDDIDDILMTKAHGGKKAMLKADAE
ncbi:hypothetical protein NX059_011545 [Plenodomus lindquistii]|nr:hypothetical protein NX059_011545 [Plenodomus lindquistii]